MYYTTLFANLQGADTFFSCFLRNTIVFDKLFLGTDIEVSTIISSILVIVGVYFVAKEPVSENNDNAEEERI